MSFGFDDELPGGFQDADFETRELEASARRHRAARKRGICTHDSTGPIKNAPCHPDARMCYDCQAVFVNERALDFSRAQAMEGLL